jgi:pimeloyl-ACP methyl ester carboxylesterase
MTNVGKPIKHPMPLSRPVIKITTALFVAGAIGVAAVWAPDRPVEDLIPTLAPPPSQFIDVDGMKAHVRDEGPADDPDPIVLLHGTSSSLHTWDGWVSKLKSQRRVIRVDMPGFGLTGPNPNGKYDIQTYSHFVASLMSQLHVQHAVLAGNSLGGYVAWKTAVDYPARITKLILIDAAGYKYESQSVPLGFKLARIPLLSPLISHVLPKSIVANSVRNVYGDPSKVTPALIERYYETTLRAGNREAVVARFNQMKGGEFEQEIKEVKQPTLIIWGGKDRLIPLEYAGRFHHDIPGSTVMLFNGLGHVPQEEAPLETVEAAQAFLNKQSGK